MKSSFEIKIGSFKSFLQHPWKLKPQNNSLMHNAAVAKRHKKRPEMSTQEKQKRTKLNYKNRTECNFTLEIMAESLMIVSASISLIIFTFFQCCTSLINSLSLHFIKFNQNANFFFLFLRHLPFWLDQYDAHTLFNWTWCQCFV